MTTETRKSFKVQGFAQGPENVNRAFVSLKPHRDHDLFGGDFATMQFFISPATARIVAMDLLNAANEADGKNIDPIEEAKREVIRAEQAGLAEAASLVSESDPKLGGEA